MDFKGKTVVITGGSEGVGGATAHAFADAGASLVLAARTRKNLEEVAEELRDKTRVEIFVMDVADTVACSDLPKKAQFEFGSVHVLVNNASGVGVSDDEGGWQAGFDVDLMASVRATWKAVPWIAEAGGGSIIHISSTSGLEAGSPPAYAAVKAALMSHSKTLAISLAPRNIRVNTVAPGSIEFPGGMWEMIKKNAPAQYESIRSSIPFDRLGSAEEVANAVVFLASDRASWITGVTLSVDGGQHKGNL